MRFALLLALVGCATTSRSTTSPPMIQRTTVQAAPRVEPPAKPLVVQQPVIASGGARLEIVEVSITPTGVCTPYQPMLMVDAIVHNHGDDFPGAPGYGLVGAHRDKFGSLIGNGGPVPEIPARGTVRVSFPIFFPVHDPSSANVKSRWEVALDVYGRYPGQMSDKVLVRHVDRPCSRKQIAQ